MKYLISLLLTIILLFNSCTMQKRRYMKGFYSERSKDVVVNNQSAKKYIASNDNTFYTSESSVISEEKLCDTIYLRSGAKMIVKVNSVYYDKTNYNLCEGDKGESFAMETRNMKRICYANGKIDSLKNIPLTTAPKDENKVPVKKPTTLTTTNTSNKNQTACDTLYFRNGEKKFVRVSNVYFDKTQYVLCNSDNEAEWDVETRTLKRICYANGTIDSLKNVPMSQAPAKTYIDPNSKTTTNYRTRELDRAAKQADYALIWAIVGVFIIYVSIIGYILAIIARNKLKGKKGYERSYRRANIIFIVYSVLYGLVLAMILLLLLLL